MAIKNIIDLNNQANTILPDNNQQLIAPVDVRTAIKDLNDSAINRITDRLSLNLRAYDPTRSYEMGEGVFYNSVLYEALTTTTGAFNVADWDARSSPSGTWGGIMGNIADQTDLASLLAAKQNSISANLPIYFSGSALNIQPATNSQNGYLSQSDWVAFHDKENAISVTSPLIRTGDTISVQYVTDSQDGVVAAADWSAINNSITDIAYADALALITGPGLNKGKFYKILGGTRINENSGTSGSIILQAIDTTTFASDGYLVTRLPRYQDIGSSIIGIWTSLVTPSINNLYIYNGGVYKNLTGTNDTAPTIDVINWILISSALSNYKTETDYIHYDFINDWIYYREDSRGNRYCFSRSNGASINGIDTFQWGNDAVYSNTIDNGIINNINNVTPSVAVNLTKHGIYNSLATIGNRTYTFPDNDGTVALLSDLMSGYIPDINTNYIFVNASGTATANGTALINALVAAALLSPNGLVISATNRAVIYLMVGTYDLGTGFLDIGEFIDIIGIGEAAEIIITSANTTGTIQIENTNDYILKNLTIGNTGGGGSITHNASQTDTGIWDNLILNVGNTDGTIFSGNYNAIVGNDIGVLNGSIIGYVTNSQFSGRSCGYSFANDIVISGVVDNCVSSINSFGCSTSGTVVISGSISNCNAGNGSFGFADAGVTISGTFKNCKAGINCIGYSSSDITISGLIYNCTTLQSSIACTTSGNIILSGTIDNCTATYASFGYSVFGSCAISGTVQNSKGATGCFGDTTSNGKLTNCIRTGGHGTHLGTIERCNFSENSSTTPTLTIGTGATVKYSTIIQSGTGECFDATGGTTASILLCTANKTIEHSGNITNNISIPHNVITNSNSNYIFVYNAGTQTDNGTALINALTAAKLLTPNETTLSTTNRAVLYLLAGTYDLGTGFLDIGQFVDLIGLGDAKDITITSANTTGTIQIENTNDYILKNLTIGNTGGGGSITHNTSQTDNGIWDSLILNASNTIDTIFNGNYSNLIGLVDYILDGDISGNVHNSNFQNNSCGFGSSSCTISGTISDCVGLVYCFGNVSIGSVIISGTIENCTSGNAGFGRTWEGTVTISGAISNCVSGIISFGEIDSNSGTVTISGILSGCAASDNSFASTGASVSISGTIENCTAGANSFGYAGSTLEIISTAKIINCNATTNSFGYTNCPTSGSGTITIDGSILNCLGTTYCFGYTNEYGTITISGIIENCTASDYSFGYAFFEDVTMSGIIRRCIAGSNSFCYVNGSAKTSTISGSIEKSTGVDNCFGFSYNGTTIVSGTIRDCIGGNETFGICRYGIITVSGLIENCTGADTCFAYSNFDNVTISGKIKNCSAGTSSFGSATGSVGFPSNTGGASIISGIIEDCTATDNSFGYSFNSTTTISGNIINSIGTSNCFGNALSTVSISGIVENCKATSGSFGSTTSTGKIINCTRTGGYGTHLGTIERCSFSENDSTIAAVTIGNGAILKYSTIYQAGTGECFKCIGEITASIYFCAANKAVEDSGVITNGISTPYNVIDSTIII